MTRMENTWLLRKARQSGVRADRLVTFAVSDHMSVTVESGGSAVLCAFLPKQAFWRGGTNRSGEAF